MFLPFASLAGWAFVPDFATRHIVRILHHVSLTYFGIVPPQPGTPAYARHYRYTFAAAVLGFLLYNLISSATSMNPSYYEILGVTPSADDTGLKQAFRIFAKRYHPDRVGPSGEQLFIQVRDAFEALKDPVVRFAYDRFGSDVLTWKDCSTPREYMRRGLTQSIGFHVFSMLGLLFWSAVGSTPLPFWRYTIYAAFAATELSLIVSPSLTSPFPDPSGAPATASILHLFLPRRAQYQHIQYLHQLLVFINVAIGRVAPRLFPNTSKTNDTAAVQQIQSLLGAANRETSMLMSSELTAIQPFTPQNRISFSQMRPLTEVSAELMDDLTNEMENLIIESNLRRDGGPLHSAWQSAVSKGRSFSLSTASKGRAEDESGSKTLPSPVSPGGTPERDDVGRLRNSTWGGGRLPSPRPSPPPPLGRGSSYVRARSISY